MKKHNQKGFTVIEIVIALIVVGALVFGGYMVLRTGEKHKCQRIDTGEGNIKYCVHSDGSKDTLAPIKVSSKKIRFSDVEKGLQVAIAYSVDKNPDKTKVLLDEYVLIDDNNNFAQFFYSGTEPSSGVNYKVIYLYYKNGKNWEEITSYQSQEETGFACDILSKYKVPKTFSGPYLRDLKSAVVFCNNRLYTNNDERVIVL